MRISPVALILVLMVVPPLRAQALPPQSGALVRWMQDGRRVEGYLLEDAVPSQPVKVQQRGSSVSREVPWGSHDLAQRITPGRKNRGALIGFGVGALIGAGVGLLSGDDKCGSSQWCLFQFSAGEKAKMIGGTLGSLGAIIGAIAAPGAVWTPLGSDATPSRVTALITPERVGLRVEF